MNKRLLIEAERFKRLCEYSFYEGDVKKDDENLLFDDLTEEDTEQGDELPMDDEPAEMADDSNTSEPPQDNGEEVDLSGDIPSDQPAEEMPPSEPLQGDQPEPEPDLGDGEIELDVTELVQGTKDAKDSADQANKRLAMLIGKFNQLGNSLKKMAVMSNKIESLEQEVIKRNPTEVEKLEMRSMDSYPYNLKLTDFWGQNPNQGAYAVKNDDGIPKSNEYVLTQQDVDSDYNRHEIENSFDVDYDEEEIDEF